MVNAGNDLGASRGAHALVGAHDLVILKDGAQTFPAMLDAIAAAERTICLETYILRDDKTGRRFGEALIAQAKRGVEVNLLYDAWGSDVSVEYLVWLQDRGVRVMAFHPVELLPSLSQTFAKLTLRNHRKLLIVDGRVAFTGGLNVSDDYAPKEEGGSGWRDTHLRIEGPVVDELQGFFLSTWKSAGGPPIEARRYPKRRISRDHSVEVAASHLRRGRRTVRHAYGRAIRSAEKRIWITNPYFLPTVRLLRNFVQAAQRGVDVRVMLAGTTDVTAVLLASRSIYGLLLKSGARLFEWEGRVLHAKTAVVDGIWSTIGSSNLDRQSLRYNLEVNVNIRDAGFARAMEAMFEDDLRHCTEITLDRWHKRSWWERGASWAAYLARDWL